MRRLTFALFGLSMLLACGGVRAQLYIVKQSTAYTITLPDLVAASDHLAGLTGQTGTAYLSRVLGTTGAVSKAASTNNISELDNANAPGQYTLALTIAETGSLGYIKGYYKSASSDPVSFTIKVVAYDPDDAAGLGLSRVDAAISSRFAAASAPANFSTALFDATDHGVTVHSVLDKTQYALSASQNFATTGAVGSVTGNVGGSVGSVVGGVIVATNQDKTGYSLVQTFPSNFANLGISVGGALTGGVIVTTNNDKTGYALTQTFPTNFALLSIDGSGRLTMTPAEHLLFAGDVFNATATSYNAAGSLGQKLNSAASAGDPLSNNVPGSYAAGTAGYVLGHKIPSTLAAADVTGNVPGVVNAYASGQDPATLILAGTLQGGLTVKQAQNLALDLSFDADRTFNAGTHTAVYTWYARNTGLTTADKTKPVLVKTTVYDASNTQVTTQTTVVTPSNLN